MSPLISHLVFRSALRAVLATAIGFSALARAADGIQWVSISLPVAGGAGGTIQFNATVKNTGTTTWGGDYYLELKDAAGNHLDYPSLAGIAPGQTVSRIFVLTLPASTGSKTYSFTALHHNVAYFGPTETRIIDVQPGQVNQGVTLAATTLDPNALPLPIINSPDSLTPDYRLRAKIIDGTQYGFHAATTWNNKGLPLDQAPPPGAYPVAALYWLKYDGWQGTLLEIGQERVVAVTVPGSVVALSSYCFGQLVPPQISISGTLNGTYWLYAKFKDPWGGEWDTTPRPFNAAVNSHNQNASLVNLPPPGEYSVELSYKRFDAAGNVVVTSPITYAAAVVYAGAGVVFTADGETTVDGGYNENGDWEQQFHPGSHQFSMPINGNMQISVSALFGATTVLLKANQSSGEDETVDGWGGGANDSMPLTPGNYTLKIYGGPGTYHVTGTVTTDLTLPAFPSEMPGTASGEFGKNFSGYIALATGSTPITYLLEPIDQAGKPPGLSIVTQGNVGIVSGFPTSAGTYQARIRATNPAGSVTKNVIFTIAKTLPKTEFSGLIVQNLASWPITQDMLTGPNNPGSLKLSRPLGAPESVPIPSNFGAVTFTAIMPRRNNLSFNPFTPSSFSSLGISDGELLVTARYPGDANYLPANVVTTYWNKDTQAPSFAAGYGLAQVLVDSTSVSLRWQAATDLNFGVVYELSLDGGATLAASGLLHTSGIIRGLTANTGYQVVLRARDLSGNNNGNPTAWSPPFGFTTLAAPPAASGSIQWKDVNGDGLRDEIIPSGSATFSYFPFPEQPRVFTYSEWQEDFIFAPGFLFSPQNHSFYRPGDNPQLPVFIPDQYIENYSEQIITLSLAQVTPVFQFSADPGYNHDLARVLTRSNGDKIYAPILDVSLAALLGLPGSIQEWLPGSPWLESSFDYFPTVLIRYATPPVGVVLNLPGIGDVTLAKGSASGTITLPNGTKVTATSTGASIKLPNGTTVAAGSNGNAALTLPSGASISAGPGGASLSIPGGPTITLNGSNLGVAVPAGATTVISNAVDALGRLLGLNLGGGDVRGQVVPSGGQPTQGGWGNAGGLIFGDRPPGVYDIAVTTDTRGVPESPTPPASGNIIVIKLTVLPPPSGSVTGVPRMWINDDNDSGTMGGNDLPGSSSPNYADSVVNGLRDLVDFFPASLNIREYVTAYPPGSEFKYKLKHADGAVNFVYTNLTAATSQNYHRQILATGFGDSFDQSAGSATTHQVTATGYELSAAFLNLISNGTGGIILLEGRSQTSQPLVVSIERANGTVLATLQMPLRISSVESMFRHVDLSGVNQEYDGASITPSPAGAVARAGDPGEPYPDSATNGKYFVFVHGYNVDGPGARGWNCEIFKRLYQSGSRARFVGVTWYGSTGLDYHKAVYHSFQAGDVLGAYLNFSEVKGDVTVAAHSLGNMLVSHAIAYANFRPTRYYMINCAVPIEAYDLQNIDAPQRLAMTEQSWKNRDRRFFTANWHELFEGSPNNDNRVALKWKGRFSAVNSIAYNFYSPGEDVVAKAETSTASILVSILRQGFNVSRGAWTAQELIKGVSWSTSLGELFMERKQAGWNARILHYGPNPGAEVTNGQLMTEPYFERFLEQELMSEVPSVASAKAGLLKVKYDLLARAIPALSYAGAVDRIPILGERNFNMEIAGRPGGNEGLWPTDGHSDRNIGRWLHSDFRNAAFPYVQPMFQEMIQRGGLQ